MKFFKAFLISFVLVAAALTLILWHHSKQPQYGGDFTLTYRGQPWRFSQAPAELNLLYFGYAKCPDVCPLALSYAGSAFKELKPEELKNIRLLFVSVDYLHDDPNAVADYAKNFYPDFMGLSGSREQIDQTIGLFPASYMLEENPKSYLGYSISHTDKIFFLNSRGQVVDELASPRDVSSIVKKIKENL
jgi:protein SCO1